MIFQENNVTTEQTSRKPFTAILIRFTKLSFKVRSMFLLLLQENSSLGLNGYADFESMQEAAEL